MLPFLSFCPLYPRCLIFWYYFIFNITTVLPFSRTFLSTFPYLFIQGVFVSIRARLVKVASFARLNYYFTRFIIFKVSSFIFSCNSLLRRLNFSSFTIVNLSLSKLSKRSSCGRRFQDLNP